MTHAAAKLIPADAHRAAKRGFIRTACQSLATGLAVPGGLVLAFTGDGLAALAAGVAGMAFAAVVNGAQSYFSILSRGIPEDYAPDLDTGQTVPSSVDPD